MFTSIGKVVWDKCHSLHVASCTFVQKYKRCTFVISMKSLNVKLVLFLNIVITYLYIQIHKLDPYSSLKNSYLCTSLFPLKTSQYTLLAYFAICPLKEWEGEGSGGEGKKHNLALMFMAWKSINFQSDCCLFFLFLFPNLKQMIGKW